MHVKSGGAIRLWKPLPLPQDKIYDFQGLFGPDLDPKVFFTTPCFNITSLITDCNESILLGLSCVVLKIIVSGLIIVIIRITKEIKKNVKTRTSLSKSFLFPHWNGKI